MDAHTDFEYRDLNTLAREDNVAAPGSHHPIDARGRAKPYSLAELVRKYLGKDMDKGLACDSRWFDTTLPAELLYYACCDAYAGLEVYHVLVPTTVPLFGVALAAQTAGEARAGEARAQDEAAGEAKKRHRTFRKSGTAHLYLRMIFGPTP